MTRIIFAEVRIFTKPDQHFYPKMAPLGKTRIKFVPEIARCWLTTHFVAIELGKFWASFEDGHNFKVTWVRKND